MPDDKVGLSPPGGAASPGSGGRARRVVERMDEAECMELLSAGRIGRLVYDSRFGPLALPFESASEASVSARHDASGGVTSGNRGL